MHCSFLHERRGSFDNHMHVLLLFLDVKQILDVGKLFYIAAAAVWNSLLGKVMSCSGMSVSPSILRMLGQQNIVAIGILQQ